VVGCRAHISYESIAPPGDGFDISRLISRVSKDIPQPLYCCVDTMIEFDDRVVRPQAFSDVLPGYDFSRRFKEHLKDLERLLLKPDPAPLFAQFAPSKIELERAKPDLLAWVRASSGINSRFHLWMPPVSGSLEASLTHPRDEYR